MDVIHLTVGLLATNCYILYLPQGKGRLTEGFVLDPGADGRGCEEILEVLKRYNIKVKAIINTHGHADHILGNEVLRMATGCEVWMSKEESDIAADADKNISEMVCREESFVKQPMTGASKAVNAAKTVVVGKDCKATEAHKKVMPVCVKGSNFCFTGVDRFLEEGESIKLVDRPVLRVVSLPGHSPGGIGLITVDKRYAFLGDLIFEQGYGRTDLWGGDATALKKSLERIRKELKTDTIICPGHGESFMLKGRGYPFLPLL